MTNAQAQARFIVVVVLPAILIVSMLIVFGVIR